MVLWNTKGLNVSTIAYNLVVSRMSSQALSARRLLCG